MKKAGWAVIYALAIITIVFRIIFAMGSDHFIQALIWFTPNGFNDAGATGFVVVSLIQDFIIFIAIYHLVRKKPANSAEKIAMLKVQANNGDAKAQYELGEIYGNGYGVPKDFAQSAIWLRMAADQGIADAQLDLGLLYLAGKGVPQDYIKAALWTFKAAQQGNTQAAARVKLIIQARAF